MFKGPMIEVEVRAPNGQPHKEWVDSDRIVGVLTAFNPPGNGSSIPTPVLSGCQLQIEGGLGFTAVKGKRELALEINKARREWYRFLLGTDPRAGGVPSDEPASDQVVDILSRIQR